MKAKPRAGPYRMARAFVALGFLLAMVSGAVTTALFFIVQTRDQATSTQQHVDCIVSYLYETDPPECRTIKADLVDRGVLPPDGGPP